MKSIRSLSTFARTFALAALLALGLPAQAQTDPLPSWNDGPAKKAIVEFVRSTTTQGSPKFVPQAERIATFAEHDLVRHLPHPSRISPSWQASWR